jgi:hypothetical protein
MYLGRGKVNLKISQAKRYCSGYFGNKNLSHNTQMILTTMPINTDEFVKHIVE